jgi:hypothetical protein
MTRFLVSGLLLIEAGLLAWGAVWHSPNNDEIAHLAAGVSHWHLGRFDLYRVNPPFVRMLAALPVLLARPATDWTNIDKELRPEWRVGVDFMKANGPRFFWYFTLARWACIPLCLAGGYLCFRWGQELYGEPAGLLALILWCFCPNIIAHGQIITPDIGATTFGVGASYFFWCWLKEPSARRAVVAGLALGLAEITKTIWIILFILWPLIWASWVWSNARERQRPCGQGQLLQLLTIALLGLAVINVAYGLEGSFQRLEEYEFGCRLLSGQDHRSGIYATGNRFRDTWVGALPVPVPANYLLGMDVQKWEFEDKLVWTFADFRAIKPRDLPSFSGS